jgi:class 3 adenylate cyclase
VALGVGMDDFRRGNEFGRFALELAERSKDPSIICKVLWIFAGMIKPWRDRLDELYPLADRARKLALDAGDLQYATYSRSSDFFPRIVSRGSSLLEALNICEEHRPYIEHSKDVMMVEMLTMGENCALALQGKTTAPYSLNCGSYDECAAELRYRRTGNLTLAFFQILIRLQLACLFGRYEDVLSLSDKGEEVVRSGSGFTQVADLYFFRGLAAVIALTRQIGNAARHRRTLRYCLKRLHVFAINSPHNFCQHEALLEAEAARVEGGRKDVLKLYNRAIDVAEAEGYTHLVGLSNERAALFCLADGQRRLAGWYLSCARAAYDKWGATAKVAQLDRDYADLLPAPVSSSREPVSASRTAAHQGERFDIAAALQASRIISSGENTERVLTHLMQLIRIQAGAESAQLLIWEGGRLRLEASATVESGGVLLFPTQSAEAGQESYSPAIVNYVLHTGHELMLGEAGTDARFAQCSYMRNRQPKSVLCSAIRHQGELLGVIYLEHTQIAGTFDGQKLEWLRLLSTEVGLAVWSARLSRYREYVHKFAPAAVAKEIDANPVSPNLAAKDTDVSILFGDLAGYTRMAEQLERRQLDEFINRAFSRFTDEIHRHEGVLLEIRGDELFVLFSDEDPSRHVWKAVHAALAISRVAASLKDELSSAYPPLIMNMGINCGVASVGLKAVDAASGSRWRYGASGTVVNVAARVRELARDGSILVSADAASRVSNDFVFEDMGEHSLKNVQNPVHIYRLTGGQEASQYH